MPERTDLLTVIACTVCLGTVFNHIEAVSNCDFHDCCHVSGVAVEMNGHDSSDVLMHTLFECVLKTIDIDGKGLRVDIDKNGSCACELDSTDGCDCGMRSGDNAVARSNSTGQKSDLNCIGSTRNTDARRFTDVMRKFLLKLTHLQTQNIAAILEY